jgi:glycosyltransferase involved in cell wall biosynthesis
MSTMPASLVSVIIPCRNAAAWLGEAIESCLAQSWSHTEIIVIDNGSTDASRDVARRYEGAITLLECSRSGASAARNVGLEQASGAFIQYLDADDLIAPDKIARQMARLAAAPAGAIATSAWARFHEDWREARFVAEPVWRDIVPEDFLIGSWLGGGMMANFAWLSPRAVIDAAGPWDETLSLNDDGEYFSRVALASSGIVFCGDARGYYRTGAGATLSGCRDDAALISNYHAIELCSKRLLARCSSSTPAKAACAALYQRFVYDAFPMVPEQIAKAEARVAALGGSDLEMGGGGAFQVISRCLGWRAARRCQLAWRELVARVS